jgi:hypothetical protein
MLRAMTVVLLAACGAPPPVINAGGPRGLRGTDHLSEARRQDEVAKERASWPDTRSAGPTDPPVGVWVRSWDSVEHERLAQIHRSRAAAIDAEFADACAGLSGEEIRMSPLRRFGIGGWNTTTGAIVYLSPTGGTPDQLLAQMRCHRAWMMLGPSDMEDCPLDLPGLAIDARGDNNGVTVSLVARDPSVIAELQRRTSKELEAASSLRPPHKP